VAVGRERATNGPTTAAVLFTSLRLKHELSYTCDRMITRDKLYHAGASLLILVVLALFIPLPAAICAALGIGAAKELIWDTLIVDGDPSWGDFLADAVGVALGVGLWFGFTTR